MYANWLHDKLDDNTVSSTSKLDSLYCRIAAADLPPTSLTPSDLARLGADDLATLLAAGFTPSLPSGLSLDHAEALATGVIGNLDRRARAALRTQIAIRLARARRPTRRLRIHAAARAPSRPSRPRASSNASAGSRSDDAPPPADEPPPRREVRRLRFGVRGRRS